MKYTEQAVETLDDASCVIANKNIEIEQLRQRVADLETLLVSSTQKQVELTSERDALIKQRDDLLAALERVSLELGIDGLLPEWEFVDEAIASVKEKS